MAVNRRRFYDRLSRCYRFVRLFDDCYKMRALDALKLQGGGRLLDAGCGDGSFLRRVKELCPDGEFFGVDNSLRMAACAKKSAKASVSIGDCLCMPYRSGSFDALFCAFVFDLFDEEEHETLLSEFWRVLAPRGVLVLVNNAQGRGVFSLVSGFYVFLSRLFPGLLLNKPVDTCYVVGRFGGFKVKKRVALGFTDIVVCRKST